MSALPNLLKSLVTAIVRYHARKTAIAREIPEESLVADLLQASCEDINSRLEALIAESTASDATRRPLLNYLLHVIQLIKPVVDGKIPFKEEQAEAFKKQLTQFYIDVLLLLNTRQGSQVTLNYNSTPSQHYGLIKGVWPITSWSVAGNVINELLLPTVDVLYTDDQALVTLKITAFVQAAEIAALKQIIHSQETELQQRQEENAKLLEENARLHSELETKSAPETPTTAASPDRRSPSEELSSDEDVERTQAAARLPRVAHLHPLLSRRGYGGTLFAPLGLASLAFPVPGIIRASQRQGADEREVDPRSQHTL
ncbi:hypothetical protein [Legionella oakridgensis]|uniref:hypothetical protein n=1 Tax=Legionella oakridgensis TaxID=29423 RepID=UPI0003DE5F64|nr:hypothetical protein [Legionella oakridgensis]ETO93577.1 hypothetical protein LOR_57c13040 [Legionella oakridgensis RV-2-2007]